MDQTGILMKAVEIMAAGNALTGLHCRVQTRFDGPSEQRLAMARNELALAEDYLEAARNGWALPIGGGSPKSTMSASRGTRLGRDFSLPENWRAWAAAERGWPDADIAAEAVLFANYWQAKAGRDGLKLDWFKIWQNWVLVSRRRPGAPGAAAPPRQLPREEQIARLERSADWFASHGRGDDAEDCRSKAASLRSLGGEDGPR